MFHATLQQGFASLKGFHGELAGLLCFWGWECFSFGLGFICVFFFGVTSVHGSQAR